MTTIKKRVITFIIVFIFSVLSIFMTVRIAVHAADNDNDQPVTEFLDFVLDAMGTDDDVKNQLFATYAHDVGFSDAAINSISNAIATYIGTGSLAAAGFTFTSDMALQGYLKEALFGFAAPEDTNTPSIIDDYVRSMTVGAVASILSGVNTEVVLDKNTYKKLNDSFNQASRYLQTADTVNLNTDTDITDRASFEAHYWDYTTSQIPSTTAETSVAFTAGTLRFIGYDYLVQAYPFVISTLNSTVARNAVCWETDDFLFVIDYWDAYLSSNSLRFVGNGLCGINSQGSISHNFIDLTTNGLTKIFYKSSDGSLSVVTLQTVVGGYVLYVNDTQVSDIELTYADLLASIFFDVDEYIPVINWDLFKGTDDVDALPDDWTDTMVINNTYNYLTTYDDVYNYDSVGELDIPTNSTIVDGLASTNITINNNNYNDDDLDLDDFGKALSSLDFSVMQVNNFADLLTVFEGYLDVLKQACSVAPDYIWSICGLGIASAILLRIFGR